MKHISLVLIGLVSFFGAHAQLSPSNSSNYTVEQTPRTALTSLDLATPYMSVQSVVSYQDGLGRPLQSVVVRGAGNAANDIVTGAIRYDAFGRPQRTYLPVSGTGTTGGLTGTVQAQGAALYNDQNPYTEIGYETSPLMRPVQQFGPGQAWRTANKAQTTAYGVATNIPRFTFNLIAIYRTTPDTYEATDIATRTTTDEQGSQVIEYWDLEGHLIRKDVQATNSQVLTTVYLYDDFGRLGAIVPPKLYNWFMANPGQVLYFRAGTTLEEWRFTGPPNPLFTETAYVYLYNKSGLLAAKHVPGAGWSDMIYDRQDRLVLSRDQQDKAEGKWRFNRYDIFGRPVMNGRLNLALNGELDILNTQNEFYGLTVTDEDRSNSPDNLYGYTNRSFPSSVSVSDSDVLTVNYYDTTPANTALSYQSSGALGTPWNSTIDQLTGTKVRNLATGAWYDSRMWYDFKGRIVQQQSQNHLGGTDRLDIHYRFNGEILQTVLRHQAAPNSPITTVATNYDQDHLGRNIQVTHSIDGVASSTLASYRYDAIGRLSGKQLGNAGSGGMASTGQSGLWTNPATWQGGVLPNPASNVTLNGGHQISIPPNTLVQAGNLYQAGHLQLQSGSVLRLNGGSSHTGLSGQIEYSWHIRGGLQGINLNASGNPDASAGRVFAMKLGYEETGLYDGNIGSQTWVHNRAPGQSRSYAYSYDNAKRLTGAAYSGVNGENYTVNNLSYDANGNLLSLVRADVDNLTYSYSATSNKLTAVSDASGNAVGFTDGHATGNDYEYWPDGNLKKDLNRGISLIEYNLLKLPRQITMSDNSLINYQYDANGQKLKMTVSGGDTRDYIGPFHYLNGTLFELSHEEGRYTPTSGYEFFHRDHLGNVRAVAGPAGISQYTDYDPWGLALWNGLTGGSSTNRMKFNGKEVINELGPNTFDFGSRFYDAAIGRMHTIDRATELFAGVSGYSFGLNNPIFNIDPTGDTTVPYRDVEWSKFNTAVDNIGLDAVTVKTQRQSGGLSGGSMSINRWLADESGHRISSDGRTYWDYNDSWNTNLFIRPQAQETNDWVGWADNIITLTPAMRTMQGLFFFAKFNSTNKIIAAKQATNKTLKMILPAWKKVNIDVTHIASGHIQGGSRVSPLKTLFPTTMNQKQVESAIRSAYKNVTNKLQTQGDRILLQGVSDEGIKIEMWLNKATNTIETAYPKY